MYTKNIFARCKLLNIINKSLNYHTTKKIQFFILSSSFIEAKK